MPRLPAELKNQEGVVVEKWNFPISGLADELKAGDRVLSVGSVKVNSTEQLNFILDQKRISDKICFYIERKKEILSVCPPLVPFMGKWLFVTNVVVGCLFWLFGMAVIFFGRLERSSVLFFLMAMALSLVIMVYWPGNDFGIRGLNWLGILLSHGLYPLTVTLLLHFSLGFPKFSFAWQKRIVPLLYLPAAAFSGVLVLTEAKAYATLAAADIDNYLEVFSAFRVFLAVYFFASTLIWFLRYRRTEDSAAKQKLKWLMFGITAGISPHILLFELPQGFGLSPLVAEQFTLAFTPLSAGSVVVAVVKHRLFDIDLLISRSIVYLLLSIFVAGTYFGLVAGVDAALWGRMESSPVVRVIVILLLAALFEPARRIAQDAVDRIFFRKRYDQRQALIELGRLVSRTQDMGQLSAALKSIVIKSLGVRRLEVFFLDDKKKKLVTVKQAGCSPALGELEADRFAFSGGPAVFELKEPRLAAFPMALRLTVENNLVGLVALGEKDQPYSEDDRLFLEGVAGQVALAFEAARAFHQLREMNLKLEQKVFERTAQMAESNNRLVEQYVQLQQLDEMKETLTRMIVHDLRNPLATIALGSELLRLECAPLSATAAKTLATVEAATRHMQDMIQSMLDTAKLEAGSMRLERRELAARELLQDCLERIRLQAEAKAVRLELRTDDITFQADGPLFERVIVNLLANAVRHSPGNETVLIECGPGEKAGTVKISIVNQGEAIPPDIQARLFEKFFQAESGARGGAGLGLHFCRMVTQAHGGRIWVQSPLVGHAHGASFLIEIPQRWEEKTLTQTASV